MLPWLFMLIMLQDREPSSFSCMHACMHASRKLPRMLDTLCRRHHQKVVRRRNSEHVFSCLMKSFADPGLDLVEKVNRTGELFPQGKPEERISKINVCICCT